MNHLNKLVLAVVGGTWFMLILAGCSVIEPIKPAADRAGVTIAGVVQNVDGPVANVVVRMQSTENVTVTGNDGTFLLPALPAQQIITITASAAGHYIGWTTVTPDLAATAPQSVTITLDEHFIGDNFEYDWFQQSFDGHVVEGSAACGQCHNSYPEWLADGHSQSAVNPRFLSMYAGTDIAGNKSPPPKKNNLGIPLPPDPDDPYHGPGFKLDFPTRSGNCATCHTPMAGKQTNRQNCGWSGCHQDTTADFAGQILDRGVSPLDLKGDAAEGISCEFCHKIGQVAINRETGLPYPDLPGILSVRLFRPEEGEDLFFGPLDDIARSDVPAPRDVYLPLQEESRFCAGCHYGILGGVVVGNMEVKGGVLVYSSYSEWLESPYSDAETGKTCQDCHMPNSGVNFIAYPERGGVMRDERQIHSHRMFSDELLQNAVTLQATALLRDGLLFVDVAVTNDQTGHHVPTDSPLRQMMLVVEAQDSSAQPLSLQQGPTLPTWTGDYAGVAGRVYAKVLQDEWTGEFPTGAIWRPVQIKEDTRLAAMATDSSQYTFAAPASGDAVVAVRLLYRKAYPQLAEWKKWDNPVIIMEETNLLVKE